MGSNPNSDFWFKKCLIQFVKTKFAGRSKQCSSLSTVLLAKKSQSTCLSMTSSQTRLLGTENSAKSIYYSAKKVEDWRKVIQVKSKHIKN